MAVKTTWPITFACGHKEERDLSAKRGDQRAGYARWLAEKDCTDCWRGTQTAAGERVTDTEWLAQKRAEETADIEEWETKAGMGELTGAEKAIGWGRRMRHTVMTGAFERLDMDGGLADDDWLATVEEPARRITSASWWIDNREAEAVDVPEMIAAASESAAAPTENPYT